MDGKQMSVDSQDSGLTSSLDEPGVPAGADSSRESMASCTSALLDPDPDLLPTAISVTNLDPAVFQMPERKAEFERRFSSFDPDATFQYFTNFRRARVNYTDPAAAARARTELNETDVAGSTVKCYYLQPSRPRSDEDDGTLHPPKPQKQFLISPPASPPDGWEQPPEARPAINFDLLAAVAQMAPGETHELYEGQGQYPSIVVHVADEEQRDSKRVQIVHTPCPPR